MIWLKIYVVSIILNIILSIISKTFDKDIKGEVLSAFIGASFVPLLQQITILVNGFIIIFGLSHSKEIKTQNEKEKYELLKEAIKNSCGRVYCYRETNRYIEQKLKIS